MKGRAMDQNTIQFVKDVLKATDKSPDVVDLAVDFIIENHATTGIPVKIGGQRHYIPEKEYDVMTPIIRNGCQNSWNNGMKIAMIKALKEITGTGLKETKEAVEDIENWH
jgi:ribosomal protein L7/L12